MKELGYDKVEVDRYGNVFGTMKGYRRRQLCDGSTATWMWSTRVM